MSNEIKIIAVGCNRMQILNDGDYENLYKVRKHLESLPEYGELSDTGGKLQEMADRLDNVYWLHTAYRESYERNKNYSLNMQEILKGCDGFVTFKEYIAMSYSEARLQILRYFSF